MSTGTNRNTHTAAVGPTAAELRMFEAYDMFTRLLERKPADAQKLAYEVHTLALRYVPPPTTQKEGR